jgi:hypothetical protein
MLIGSDKTVTIWSQTVREGEGGMDEQKDSVQNRG